MARVRWIGAVSGLLALAGSGSAVPASAADLDKETCLLIDREVTMLENEGIAKDLETSPDWAKITFSNERIARIKLYLEMKEKWLFRCPNLHVVKPAPEDAPATDATAAAPTPAKPPEGAIERK